MKTNLCTLFISLNYKFFYYKIFLREVFTMDENQNNFGNGNTTININQGYQPTEFQSVPTPNENIVNNTVNNNIEKPKKEKNTAKGPGFGRTIFLPFLSGLIGAALVIAICLGVPSVRNVISGLFDTKTVSNEVPTNSTSKGLEDYSEESALIAERLLPSVVGIDVSLNVSSVIERNVSKALAEGSGIIVSEDGYIITNSHVVSPSNPSSHYEVSGSSYIQVYLHNEDIPYTAQIIGKDDEIDLAVIKIDKNGLTPAILGDSSTLKQGEWCMAIGNPLGMISSVTTGTISALDRNVTDSDGQTHNVIQTSAAINSGNSGGALINSKGEIIGVNTLKASGEGVEGLAFAIPVNTVSEIYNKIMASSNIHTPYIGAFGSNYNNNDNSNNTSIKGVYVNTIDAGSPAALGGMQVGDVITRIDNNAIEPTSDLDTYLSSKQVGDTITVIIVRNNQEYSVTIIIGEKS
jgi:serine protease Do